MPLIAKLVVVGGDVKTAEIKLRLPSTIGRGRGATIMLPHPLVSRQHCELFESDGRLVVRDLGSLNGTFINNERVSEAPLPPGELLTVGAVTFRAVYETQEATSPPEGPGPRLKSTHSRDTDPNGTVRDPSSSKSAGEATVPAPALPASSAEEPVSFEAPDFNFEMPLTPVDEDARTTDRPPVNSAGVPPETVREPKINQPTVKPAAPTKSSKSTAAKSAAPTGKTPAAAEKTPAAAATPVPDAKSPDFAKWEQEEEEKVEPKGEDDDDFDDFLKSLGPK